MRKTRQWISGLLILANLLLIVGCTNPDRSKIDGISDAVYQRGMAYIRYLDATPMIGQQDGEDRLNAIAPDDSPDTEVLFEDVLYILWVYHNLKSVDSAAAEINAYRSRLGVEVTVQEAYDTCRENILKASSPDDLWQIWNDIKRD